ncbi:MAG: pilus assembly protein PilX [Ruminococcus sp.]|nr:pilus assembly protein PilX [Ruminococcus sp.]
MRKLNAIVIMTVLVLFLIHAAMGSFQLAGILPGGSTLLSVMAWVMLTLICLHAVIGIKLTADTLRAIKASGTSYFKENKLFWTRRISGFAIMLFILFHVMIFMGRSDGGAFRLSFFGGLQLAGQILLVLSIALHVMTNIKPLMLALGAKSYKELALDILFVLSAVLLFSGAGFVVYYIRWSVF